MDAEKFKSIRRHGMAALWLVATGGFAWGAVDSPAMTAGEPALAPIQFVVFCLQKPARCLPNDDVRLISFDNEHRKIDAVNRDVNQTMVPFAHPPEVPWQDDATMGDCNEYALKKRSKLIDMGYPSSALLLAVAILPSGEAHLVTVVATDSGDFVLDNLSSEMLRWDQLAYRWIKRSSPADPRRWQTIMPAPGNMPLARVDDGALIIGSIKAGRGLDASASP